jgi:hypothetical protein
MKRNKAADAANVDLNPFVIRQGDVNLVRVDSLPTGLADITPETGRIVLQHGEATGHAHAFYDTAGIRVFARDKKAARPEYLQIVKTTGRLRHEEHTEARIPPGIYRLPTQVEHSDSEEPRIVAD